jgi:phage tail P2-like protein
MHDTPPRLMGNIMAPNATMYERSLASMVDRLLALPIPIDKLWNPHECPAELLPYLAWALSVDLWDPDWDEYKKRSVIAHSIEMHQLKGTEEGIRRHIETIGSDLIQVVVPPQNFYCGPDLTKEQWDEWIRQMPQIRIYLGHEFGEVDNFLYLDDGFMTDEEEMPTDFISADLGWALYGRRAIYRYKGVDTPIKIVTITDIETDRVGVEFERAFIPGLTYDGVILDVDFADNSFIGSMVRQAQVVTYALDRSYHHEESVVNLSAVWPGLEPIDVRYERNSDIGDASLYCFLDHDFPDVSYVAFDDAANMLADRVYLHDEETATPVVDGIGWLDHSRLGMPPYHAELLVDAPYAMPETATCLNQAYLEQHFLVDQDLSQVYKSMDAVEVSMALRDKILMSFQTTKPLSLAEGIPLDGSFTFGSRQAASL